MKLNINDIQSIAVGVTYVDEKDGLIRLHRFNSAAEELYKVVDPVFYRKTRATAGIRLEFTTSSNNLYLEVETDYGASRQYFEFAIYVNGEKYAHLGCQRATGTTVGKWALQPEGEKTVAIYFPWSVAAYIKEISLDDGATLAPVKKSCKMLSYGDSITHGYDCASPECSYASIIADSLNAYSINRGIGAEIFRPELAELADDDDISYITVAYGTNDWHGNASRAEMEEHCRGFYKALSDKYPNAKIFAITPVWRHDWLKATNVGRFYEAEQVIREQTADLENVTVICGIDLIPHELQNFSPDGLHPNNRGFKFYGEALAKEIKKYTTDEDIYNK